MSINRDLNIINDKSDIEREIISHKNNSIVLSVYNKEFKNEKQKGFLENFKLNLKESAVKERGQNQIKCISGKDLKFVQTKNENFKEKFYKLLSLENTKITIDHNFQPEGNKKT